jgi:uncharacterized membrane protein (TIGR02234 family)
MTSETEAVGSPRPGRRRELAALVLAGAAGAGLVLLATRQELARIVVVAPRPLPTTATAVSWQDVQPALAALAVAALASMAAVLATARGPRRVTGLVTAALGVGIAALAVGRVTAADVLAAGHSSLSLATGTGAGSAPGSTTAGSGSGGTVGSLTGFPAHVLFTGTAWRGLLLTGAAVILIAGLVTFAAAARLPVMSSRYERGGASGPRQAARRRPGPATWPGEMPPLTVAPAGMARNDAATMWETLTSGADPTARTGDADVG